MNTNFKPHPLLRGMFLSLLVGLGIGSTAGLVARSAPPPAKAPPPAAPAPRADPPHAELTHPMHGEDDPIELSLEPASTFVDTEGNQRLQFEYEVDPSLETPTELDIAYEVVTPTGDVLAASAPASATVTSPEQTSTGNIVLPPALPDGYLLVRATVAGSDGQTAVTQIAEQYVHVVDGQPMPISSETWHAESGIDEAYVTETPEQPQTPEEARALFDAP
jgi:hypothetical protein